MADDRALPAFTLFTITYQRTAELGRLFASLCRQTRKDFVWLIVSDETNDATRQAVDQWREQADFDICYVELTHGGKTRAMREGFRHVRTPLIIDIDDDELVPHCVAVFKEAWQAVERQGRADIGMINALSVDDEGSGGPRGRPVGLRGLRLYHDGVDARMCRRVHHIAKDGNSGRRRLVRRPWHVVGRQGGERARERLLEPTGPQVEHTLSLPAVAHLPYGRGIAPLRPTL